MRIYFDTEFIEDGKTIDLVSIGLVREDGATYYAESSEADLSKANDWVKENVLVHLKGNAIPRDQIAREILEFVGESPEFWAYYADYDWVALCQLYGRMIDLPEGWPMFCQDLIQLAKSIGNPQLPKQDSVEHHALADAIWNQSIHGFLQSTIEKKDAEVERLRKVADDLLLLIDEASGELELRCNDSKLQFAVLTCDDPEEPTSTYFLRS